MSGKLFNNLGIVDRWRALFFPSTVGYKPDNGRRRRPPPEDELTPAQALAAAAAELSAQYPLTVRGFAVACRPGSAEHATRDDGTLGGRPLCQYAGSYVDPALTAARESWEQSGVNAYRLAEWYLAGQPRAGQQGRTVDPDRVADCVSLAYERFERYYRAGAPDNAAALIVRTIDYASRSTDATAHNYESRCVLFGDDEHGIPCGGVPDDDAALSVDLLAEFVGESKLAPELAVMLWHLAESGQALTAYAMATAIAEHPNPTVSAFACQTSGMQKRLNRLRVALSAFAARRGVPSWVIGGAGPLTAALCDAAAACGVSVELA